MMNDAQNIQRPIVITTGEPAGIGPELIAQLLQTPRAIRAARGGRRCGAPAGACRHHRARVDAGRRRCGGAWRHGPYRARSRCGRPVCRGKLDPANVEYVIETLRRATDGCLAGDYVAMVTGPIQKSVIREAGHNFIGHTEFLAAHSGVETPVMMLVNDYLARCVSDDSPADRRSTHSPDR